MAFPCLKQYALIHSKYTFVALYSPEFRKSLCKSSRRSECRRNVEWNDQAENLYQIYVDFSYILLVFSYIDRFLGFG